MNFRRFPHAFAVMAIGKRLGVLLVAVACYCAVVSIISWHWDVRVIVGGLTTSAIGTLILSLLMSFRNRVAYERWWEARRLWGQLTNDSRNLAVKLAAFVPAEVLAQSCAGDLLASFAEALKRHLRDGSLRLRDLPGFEHEQTEPAANPEHVPMYLAGRLYDALAQWRKDGHIDGEVLWILDVHLRQLLDVCGACERIRNTPMAPSYKALLRTGLLLNILTEPWLTMPDIGFWGIPIFLIVCFFLLGVELIDSVVEEPFGTEHDDLDLDRYCQTIRDGVRTALTVHTGPPV